MKASRRQRGSVLVEFSIMGTVFLLMWIFIVQMALAMWQYHTIQYAVKVAGSYTTLHGSDCSSPGNSCTITIGNIAALLKNTLIGVDPTQVTVTFNAIKSDHVTVASTVTCQLSGGSSPCTTNTTTWPPVGNNSPGLDIQIQTEYQMQNAMARVWLPGFTQQMILF